jgi:hypothetical protein
MLHLVTLSHTPDACPGKPGNEEIHPCMQKMNEAFEKAGIRSVGRYADPAGHLNWLVMDAPNAHAIQQVIMESGLLFHARAEIRPVLSMD